MLLEKQDILWKSFRFPRADDCIRPVCFGELALYLLAVLAAIC